MVCSLAAAIPRLKKSGMVVPDAAFTLQPDHYARVLKIFTDETCIYDSLILLIVYYYYPPQLVRKSDCSQCAFQTVDGSCQ